VAAESEGHAPLLEAAVLVSENCPDCRGTGYRVKQGEVDVPPWDGRDPSVPDVPNRTVECSRCEGAGREVREVPLTELRQMLQGAAAGFAPLAPSEMRGRA
jgi:DnaJ-class molecular chaperone